MLSYHICGLKCGKLTDKGRHKVITITQIDFHVSELKKKLWNVKKEYHISLWKCHTQKINAILQYKCLNS